MKKLSKGVKGHKRGGLDSTERKKLKAFMDQWIANEGKAFLESEMRKIRPLLDAIKNFSDMTPDDLVDYTTRSLTENKQRYLLVLEKAPESPGEEPQVRVRSNLPKQDIESFLANAAEWMEANYENARTIFNG